MPRTPHALALLLLLLATAEAAADCPEAQQPQPAFGSGRHLVAYVVLSTCDLLDRAVKPTPAEVRRYLEAAAAAADQQVDWHANYSCPEDGQEDAYPAEVERQLSPELQAQDTLFDLPVDVASSAADCFSEAVGDGGGDAGEGACAPCADHLNLRARLRGALSAKAKALAAAVRAAAAPARCAQGGHNDDDADAACREWQRQRTPAGLLSVSVSEAAEAALRLWERLCASAAGCCGAPGHALTVRDQLARFQAALDDATAAALQQAMGDALGAARQVGGRSRLGAAASGPLEQTRRLLGAALADLRQVVRSARAAQRQALGAALLAGGCAAEAAGAAEAEAAAWALARAAVGGAAARLLGDEARWGGAARGFRLTASRGLRALQLALCQAQRVSRNAAALSATVLAMLAHSAHQPADTHRADSPPVSAAPHPSTICAALLVTVAAVLPARLVL